MSFPLKDWIDSHASVPHHLAHSGMLGTLATVRAALRRPMEPSEEPLRRDLARLHGVDPTRIFLTHGATEADAMVLFYLAQRTRGRLRRAPRFFLPVPDYPPLFDAARAAGFQRVRAPGAADVLVASDPNNPTGLSPNGLTDGRDRPGGTTVVDETFREFTSAPSLSLRGDPALWVCRSFTKAYGADALRVGYVVAPASDADAFDTFLGVVLDSLPLHSVGAARALLRDRDRILAETRRRFRTNLRLLREEVPSTPELAAPVWFDQGSGGGDGDRFARRALRAGVLVCPGSFFGDPSGVRVCLTQPSFPADLAAYLPLRSRWF